MRTFNIFLFLLILINTTYSQKNQPAPNIIIIMADDMGYSDLGCYGSEIKTPFLDGLATGGMRLTNFYNNARCSPSRASLMTGLYPHQAGVGQMDVDLKVPAYQGYLNKESVTIAEVVKGSGYNTYLSGKWHIGGAKGTWPIDRGFDRSFSLINGVSNYFGTKTFNSWYESVFVQDSLPIYPGGEDYYLTDAINNQAVEFIKTNKQTGKPFFLYVAHAAPHWPLHALKPDIDKYETVYQQGWDKLREQRYKKMQHLQVIPANAMLSKRDGDIPEWRDVSESDQKDWSHRMAVYAAMIESMDRGIGTILQTLKEQDELDNTYIFFLSDNGACAEDRILLDRIFKIKTADIAAGGSSSWQSYEKPWANLSNTPFRSYKSFLEEGGVKSPFIAFHAKNIKSGSMSANTHHIMDLMPTIMNLTHSAYPKKYHNNDIKPLQGLSMSNTLSGKTFSVKRSLFWEHEGNKAVRNGKWKLVKQYNLDWQLFNLKRDPVEAYDLIKKRTGIARKLIKKHSDWQQSSQVLDWGPTMLEQWENRINTDKAH